MKIAKMFLPCLMILGISALAMPPPPQTNSSDPGTQQTTQVVKTTTTQITTFRVNVVSRTVQAVNYRHRGGATKLNFAGTDLMPAATGEAKVESKKGYIEIEVEFANLAKPTTFGTEYLTYVMWAISPEGRAVNLGEVLVGDNDRSKLDVTTDLQAFALIVTAEPYYAVRQPSNVVVLENVIREDTKGTTEAMSAKYELLERGGYIPTGYKFDPVVLNAKLPLEFFEARNALRIAQSVGAEKYASSSYQHAVGLMNQADGYATGKHIDKKQMIAVSREAVQTAEDAREIAVKKLIAEHQSNQLQASAQAADEATRQKELAQAETAKTKSDMELSQTKSADQVAAAQADTEQARLAATQAQQQLQVAESDKAAMRARLSQQLNSILQTRDTARGLIVSMSDVLFDTGKYTLKPGAREKLSKVAGILMAYPGLNIAVGGYTDNVGTDQLNQGLSEQRAGSVRDYLVQQGVSTNSITAKGFGNTLPVASNDSSAGRQENRRVELVVSGESIGNDVNVTTGSVQ
ncbi:MAG TPA: OmpA family protein [Candidatus Limnocylindrales bacterium]|nr:OmpA family protein [Candidatus Limnocylindrales bacterium]